MSSVPFKTPVRKEDTMLDYIFKKLAGLNMDRPLTQQQRTDMLNCSRDYSIAIGLLIFSSAMIYVGSTDNTLLTDRMYLYTAMICVPLLAGSYFILPLFRRNLDAVSLSAVVMLVLIIVIVVYFMMRAANTQSVIWGTYFFMGLSIVACILTAIALFRITTKSLKNVRGWNGFVLNFLFYIPCLLIDLYEIALDELKTMPTIVAITLAIVLGIVFLLYLRPIQNWVIGRMDDVRSVLNYPRVLGKNLLPTAVSLSRKTVIAGNDVFTVPTDTEFAHFVKVDALNDVQQSVIQIKQTTDALMENFAGDNTYRRNYAISAWIYLNAAPSGGASTNILVYGESNASVGKPAIVYKNNQAVVILTDRADALPEMEYELDAPFQQWFMVAVSYNGNKATVFLNGKIVYATDMANGMVPLYGMGDVMYSGDKNGLKGAICSVMYYETPITLSQVITQYNLLKSSSPPILV